MTQQQQAKAQQKAEVAYPENNIIDAINHNAGRFLRRGYLVGIKEVLNNPDEWGLADKSKCCVWVKASERLPGFDKNEGWLCEQPQPEIDKDKEIERLKGLIEEAYRDGYRKGQYWEQQTYGTAWKQFCSNNNL